VCQVVTTVASAESARALASGAVVARLAACAQVFGPLTSTYRWEGELQTAEEWQVIFKTTIDRYEDLQAHVLEQHEYDVPELLMVPVAAGNPVYLGWVSEEVAAEP
jgi:periplasmic divalent cation tolerance protein